MLQNQKSLSHYHLLLKYIIHTPMKDKTSEVMSASGKKIVPSVITDMNNFLKKRCVPDSIYILTCRSKDCEKTLVLRSNLIICIQFYRAL